MNKKILIKPAIFFSLIIAVLVLMSSSAFAASLTLSTNASNLYQNDEFLVDLTLDTEGQNTTGLDAYLRFSSSNFEVKDVSFYSLYDLNDLHLDNYSGSLKLFATNNEKQSFYNGKAKLATIKLKAKEPGTGQLYFICGENKTNDTNIWSSSSIDIVDCPDLNSISVNIKSGCAVPDFPDNPKAESGPNSGQVTLSWDKVSADYYSIAYGPSSLNYLWGAANVGNVSSYTVSGLNPGDPYYFIITAVNSCGSSGADQEVAAYAYEDESEETEPAAEPSKPPLTPVKTDIEKPLASEEQQELVAPPKYWGAKPASALPSATVKPIIYKDEEGRVDVIKTLWELLTTEFVKWLGIVILLLSALGFIFKNIKDKNK
jgi:hypothetical protein